MPAGCAGKATVGYTFAVAAHVVDPAGKGERREQGTGRVGDMKGGAQPGDRRFVSCARAVEESEAENDSASAATREPVGFTLGGERGARIGATSVIGVSSQTGPSAG